MYSIKTPNSTILNPTFQSASTTFADIEHHSVPPKSPKPNTLAELPPSTQSSSALQLYVKYPNQVFQRFKERKSVNFLHILGAVVVTVVLIVGVSLAISININSSASSSSSTSSEEPTSSDVGEANFPAGTSVGGVGVDITTLKPVALFELNHETLRVIKKQGKENFDFTESFEYVPHSEEYVFESATTFQSAQETYVKQRDSFSLNFDVGVSKNFFFGKVESRVWGSNSEASTKISTINKEEYEETNLFRKIYTKGYFELKKGKLILFKTAFDKLKESTNVEAAIKFVLTYGSHFIKRNYVGAFHYSVNSLSRAKMEDEFNLDEQKKNCLGMSIATKSLFGTGFSSSSEYCKDVQKEILNTGSTSKMKLQNKNRTMPANFEGKFNEGVFPQQVPQPLFEHLNEHLYNKADLIQMDEIIDWLHPLQKTSLNNTLENQIKSALSSALEKYASYMNPKRCDNHCDRPGTISVVKKPTEGDLTQFNNSPVDDATCRCICPQFTFGDRCQFNFYSEKGTYISPEAKEQIIKWRDNFKLKMNGIPIEPGKGRRALRLSDPSTWSIGTRKDRTGSDKSLTWEIDDAATGELEHKVELYAKIFRGSPCCYSSLKYPKEYNTQDKELELIGTTKSGSYSFDSYLIEHNKRKHGGVSTSEAHMLKLRMASNANSHAEKWISSNCFLEFGWARETINTPDSAGGILVRSSFKRVETTNGEDDEKLINENCNVLNHDQERASCEKVTTANNDQTTTSGKTIFGVPKLHLRKWTNSIDNKDRYELDSRHAIFVEIKCNAFPDGTMFRDA